MAVGTSLGHLLKAHERRAISRNVVAKRSEDLLAGKIASGEDLNVSYGGEVAPLFVLGLHDPDDVETARVIA